MIVLDTNVISELMRPAPASEVKAWTATRPREDMAITAISMTEILSGIANLPDGKRRKALEEYFEAFLTQGFGNRILPFDDLAARRCADIREHRRKTGAPISSEDSMIAAIARVHSADVATRDEGGFTDCGVTVINPWAA